MIPEPSIRRRGSLCQVLPMVRVVKIKSASTDRQIEVLKDAVIKLVETVGQVKGRTEVLTAAN